MQITNLTSKHYHLPGFELRPNETTTLADAHYLSDDSLRGDIHNLIGNGKISVADSPVGFPVPTGDELDADIHAPGSNGGSQPAQVARVALTNEHVLALPSLPPIDVVPAPGSGKVNVALAAVYRSHVVSSWTNVDAAATIDMLYWPSGEVCVVNPGAIPGIFQGDWIECLTAPDNLPTADPTDYEDVPISVSIENGAAGDFGGGGDNNTLTIAVVYAVVSV